MQQALPADKATPFFRGVVSAKGKLKKAGTPQVTGPTAIVRVTAERGAWDFKISLEASDKITELLITEAAAKAPAAPPVSAQRFTKVTNKLFHAINPRIRRRSRQFSTLRCSSLCRPTRPLPFSAKLCPPPASSKAPPPLKSLAPPPSCESRPSAARWISKSPSMRLTKFPNYP